MKTTKKVKSRGQTVILPVKAADWRAAARVVRDGAGQDLAVVLAAFVADLAQTARRPGRWAPDLIGVWLATRSWPRPQDHNEPCR